MEKLISLHEDGCIIENNKMESDIIDKKLEQRIINLSKKIGADSAIPLIVEYSQQYALIRQRLPDTNNKSIKKYVINSLEFKYKNNHKK